MKTCSKCKKEKTLINFGKITKRKKYLNSWCDDCRKELEGLRRREKGAKPKLRHKFISKTHIDCLKCEKVLNLEEFNFNPRGVLKRQPYCKKCESIYHFSLYQKKFDSIEKYAENIIPILKKRKKCSLSENDIIEKFNNQNKKCFFSKEILELKSKSWSSISVDRIDSKIGYTKENSVLVCWAVNKMKQNLPIKDFIEWCKKISKNNI